MLRDRTKTHHNIKKGEKRKGEIDVYFIFRLTFFVLSQLELKQLT